MTKDWKNDSVVLTPTSKPDYAPSCNGPALWYHQDDKAIYTGLNCRSSSFDLTIKVPPPRINSFKPDGSGSGTWAKVIPQGDAKLKNIGQTGNAATANGVHVGVSLNGQNGEQEYPGLLTYHMDTKTFENNTGAADPAGQYFNRGQMSYIPIYGQRGIMAVLGG